mmetsp:Transcript_29555/g.48486  ORF Transcript_29555/g.48486 Transcript_29555/m.48486 type:complete len:123 (-) Transcript_29555:1922-2290(-)
MLKTMDRTDKNEEKIAIRHSDPPLPPPSYRRVHSTPTVIERHHSAPSFACNQWGNEKTRRSYKCLTALNSHHVRFCRRRRCTSCAKLSEACNTPTKIREWWGMFVDLSDVDDIGSLEGVKGY